MWTSPDGITWTRVPDDETVRGVMLDVNTGGPGLMAVGCVCPASWTPVVSTSLDRITWTPIPDDGADLRPTDHMYSANIRGPYLVIVGSDGSGTARQRDAVVWMSNRED